MTETNYDFLNNLDASYAEAEEKTFDIVPDGKYNVRIDSVCIKEAQTGNSYLSWDLIITEGEQSGRYLFKRNMLLAACLGFFKGDLAKCRIQLPKISDLPAKLPEFLDLLLEVRVKTKTNKETGDDNQETYISKYLGKAEAGSTKAEGSATSDNSTAPAF